MILLNKENGWQLHTRAALAGSGRSEAHHGDGNRDDGEETHFDRVEFNIEYVELVVVELREADRSNDDDAMLNRYCAAIVLTFIFSSVLTLLLLPVADHQLNQ